MRRTFTRKCSRARVLATSASDGLASRIFWNPLMACLHRTTFSAKQQICHHN